jgi:hypothetical protein
LRDRVFWLLSAGFIAQTGAVATISVLLVTVHPSDPDEPTVADVLDRAAEDLATRYHGIFATESVHALVDESYQLLA